MNILKSYHTNYRLLPWLLLILMLWPVELSARSPGKKMQRFIDREILDQLPPGARLQLHLRDARNGETVYSRQGEENCVPASTIKLLTAGLACDLLGADFQFQTRLLADIEQIRQDTLFGNIHLIADGDPSLTSDDLSELTRALAEQLGAAAAAPLLLQGDLVLETAVFDTISRGPGWMWDDGDYAWSADVTSLIVNRNCIGLECRQLEDGQRYYWLPALEPFEVEWTSGSSVRRREGNRFEIGRYAFQQEPVLYVRNLLRPQETYGRALLQLLAEQGIELTGELRLSRENTALAICSGQLHSSAPLRELLPELLQQSSNLYAEALFKRCAHAATGEPGSWKAASELLTTWLADTLELSQPVRVVDGSGMSRYNLLSPELVTELLFLYQQQPWFNVIQEALPVMGRQGTVANREVELRGGISRVKTGSLSNHKLITGYLERDGSPRWIFYINIDGYTNGYRAVVELQDSIISYLAELK